MIYTSAESAGTPANVRRFFFKSRISIEMEKKIKLYINTKDDKSLLFLGSYRAQAGANYW